MPPFLFATSIPKAGTHCLASLAKVLGYRAVPVPKRGTSLDMDAFDGAEPLYLYGHHRFDPELARSLATRGYRVLVLVRDPRDICLSMADFLKAGRVPGAGAEIAAMPISDLRAATIRGFDLPTYRTSPIRKICKGWLPWQAQGAVILRYEDIARSLASGILMQEVAAVGIDPAAFLAAARRTYRLPRAGTGLRARWRTDFDRSLARTWRENARGVAADLGYDEGE